MRQQALRALVWLTALGMTTATLLVLRPQLDKAHVALAYLLVVLGASSRGGLRLGLGLAVLTFLCFNFFFLPPYHTFTLNQRVDWLILGSYLITAAVAAALLSRAEREAAERIRLAAEAEHAAALRETDRLKDAVIAAVSHDLRTPLTSIKALAHDIANEGDERARVIGTEADRLNRYVAGLLDLSALNSGALRLNLEANTIEDVVGAAIGGVAAMLDGRHLRTNLGEGDVLLARFDFVYTVRILSNLIENAHKYSPPDSAIEIDATRLHDFVEIAVSDRGNGIPPAERERVFRPFYRPQGAAADGVSTGLGLAIARRFAEAQGGTLTVEDRVGGGSRFLLRLPALELNVETAREASS